jgi:hypothetical protein
MDQKFVYHALARRNSRPRSSHASSAVATIALKEYIAYVGMLSAAVVIAIITFAYAANITVRWLDAVAKPGFFDTAVIQKAAVPAPNGWAVSVQPVKFAAATAKASR